MKVTSSLSRRRSTCPRDSLSMYAPLALTLLEYQGDAVALVWKSPPQPRKELRMSAAWHAVCSAALLVSIARLAAATCAPAREE